MVITQQYQLIINNMAKIILKTNLANKNVFIPNVSVEAQLNKTPKPTELTITPAKGFVIDNNQITHGLLPSEIKSISFFKSTGNIIKAKVTFNTTSPQTVAHGLLSPPEFIISKRTSIVLGSLIRLFLFLHLLLI